MERRTGKEGVSGGGGSCYEGIAHRGTERSTAHSDPYVRKVGLSE